MKYLDSPITLPELDKTYGFLFETITNDFSNLKKISYLRKIEITRYKNNGNDLLFHLFLSDIEIKSNVSIENIFFLKKIGTAFDEIELEINDYGKIIKILNFEELGKRWEIIRAKLAIDNIGYVVESYMQSITNSLKEEQTLISFFSDYKMFGLYFSSLYRNSFVVEKQRKIIDCGNTLIKERFYSKDEKFDTYLITGMPVENVGDTDFIKYHGIIEYRENQIELAVLEIEKEKSTILYNIYKTSS
ncbi:hypothetical protein DBB36_21865 [Flavobacterium sp. WLB]|uniref:hypothetical protein n=1 Tax=unclassified Flavobacterium TaxID=196869 RepID=UPI0006ABC63E|nr:MULTISPECIES: hypothetical protein [unclassified Flavobacterium]KOP39805.1 hypothetical protein AKO67_02670 [Flavobacterium sp. VMW]OWU92593.1 hypothetical protein APR43_00590 [Flavobacterium sp. NLM]PUU67845.1 hypothetical protein DBB36_21865 [Flavobacterium sp. WLB]